MSQKITSKNLHYSSTLPPFLARLRGQADSEADSSALDPILAARRRPAKARSGSAEAEDAPLVVDEQGNAVSVTINADGSVKEQGPEEARAGRAGGDEQADTDAATGEKLAGIGDGPNQRKKRKMGKVIGADADEEDAEAQGDKSRKRGSAGPAKTEDQGDSARATKAKTKKKAKKIKLSFGDDEG
ncbi:hypothetical protein MFIFM68171_11242 [Madurella fahalii]|uniref:DUF4604 domain-containing protein n=1 Tax=Madurella fahalii TaxID=1157608 RepID=A0ABQ0GTI3_9PEZI